MMDALDPALAHCGRTDADNVGRLLAQPHDRRQDVSLFCTVCGAAPYAMCRYVGRQEILRRVLK